ncbi:MAG: glycine--tRNA ligase subunit beta [Peptococcaceae bacterium]|nr:glycine--tRNA ligase subunit beta [Peptococcaceae bacterium]
MADYLLEIGTEEIPASFIEKALGQMREGIADALARQRVACGQIRTLGTPRRLALLLKDLAERGEDQTEEVRGPAKKAAYDQAGQPTRALLGFAGGQGVTPDQLVEKEVNGNIYVYAQRLVKGRETAAALPELIPRMIQELSFPKFMRWGDLDFRFARPIRWLVSLLDDQVLPLTVAGVTAGRQSRGHRFLSGEPFALAAAGEYEAALEKHSVIPDPARRRALIWEGIEAVARENQAVVAPDEELLAEVTYLLEWPTALMGGFKEAYLEIPEEVVITPMREHQRYFPVRDQEGKLLNRFVTLRDGGERSLDLVREGNEKVLAARLADARFFWDEDRKRPLEAYLPALDKVVFQEKLGTVGDKVRRLESLTDWIAGALGADGETRAVALRAARLAKADLTTNMVFEFAELQGIMGRYYALACGEPPAVAQAILEHYRPRFAGDDPAASLAGAYVALADKMDTIAGIFAVGIEPTGSQDPYALRRAATGICQTLLARDLPLALEDLILQALGQYTFVLGGEAAAARALEKIKEFFAARVRNILSEAGYRYDVVDCALGTPWRLPRQAEERAAALKALRDQEGFRQLLAVFTRANNLAKKEEGGGIDPALLREEREMVLHARLLAARAGIGDAREKAGLKGVIWALAGLADPVNAFFEGVMVMAEDAAVRRNRLALLRAVVELTRELGDLSKLTD